jgi:hypothetical protein
MNVGMPEGLANYAEIVLERVDQVEEYEFTEANETYIMPKLRTEQRNEL